MKRRIVCLLLLMLPCCVFANQRPLEEVLKELDKVIERKDSYIQKKEAELSLLKERLSQEKDARLKYELCDQLFNAYLHYQADSAFLYIDRKERLATELADADLLKEITVNRAETAAVMGMFSWTDNLLEQVKSSELPPDLLGYYYRVMRMNYDWQATYFKKTSLKEQYFEKSRVYRDSIGMVETSTPDYRIRMEAELLIERGSYEKAIRLLDQLAQDETNLRQQALAYYSLTKLYKKLGDVENLIYHWALCAIADLTFATREYVSLQELAYLLYERGDLDRAYKYLNCSMNDAAACNARLRSLGIAEFFPIIDKAYKQKEDRNKQVRSYLMASVSLLAVILFFGVFGLYRWNKKLSAVRNDLALANGRLQAANRELAETGKIKEVYIAHYLNRCVGYLDKLETYRHSLAKLAITSRVDDLFKAIKSEQFIRDERKNFYHEFDQSFLDLYPNFIQSFNALLVEEHRISPKYGELLTTELRIFALIRLGVTDSNSIAHFLGYSLATVYNYRSKMRNRAKGDKDTFEQQVMNL